MAWSRCAFRYKDGAQCMWQGPTEMCSEHAKLTRDRRYAETKRQANKKAYAQGEKKPPARGAPIGERRVRQPSRVQSAKAILPQLPPAALDHTAPWHCSDPACERCTGKPAWAEWRGARCG